MGKYLDIGGTRYLLEQLHDIMERMLVGDIDLSDYVTKSELQTILDGLQIDVDLSSYATKEELENAIKGIDLSAYATREEIPSLDGYATEEYVDNALANVPTGEVDLSNYYNKEETYNKTEVDEKVASAGGSEVMILSMKDWKELNTKYNYNVNFQSKRIYIDTSIAFKNLLSDTEYRLYLYDGDGKSMMCHNYIRYKNGILDLVNTRYTDNGDGTSSRTSIQATLYDKSKSDSDTWDSYGYPSPTGGYINGWKTTSLEETTNWINHCLYGNVFQTQNYITTPNFGYKHTTFDAYDIKGKELYLAFLKCIIKIEDADGNEVAFKTVPTTEDYLEYVNTFNGVDLSNYYTKSEVDALIPTVSDGEDGIDGITPHIDETTKHWFIGETDTGVLAEGVNGVDGTNGQDGADGYTPIRGTDYWTEQDIQTIKDYIDTELGVIENGSY